VNRRHQDSDAANRAALRLVFQLFTCRVLEDKGVISPSTDPEQSLRLAKSAFSDNIDAGVTSSRYVTRALVDHIHSTLRSRFAFSSLTSAMLGHAYERSLITPTLRRERGVFYTPPAVTRYILSRLPLEVLPFDRRVFLD